MNKGAAPKQDLHFRRIFASPVEKVWTAWTDPEFIKMWWGPDGFICPSAEMDVREGGVSLVCMRAPQQFGGQDSYNSWTYSRIVPNRLMEFTVHFTDKEGKPLHPVEMGMPAEMPCEVRHSVAFTELENGGPS
ncbi:hypothetical protein PAECIP111802_07158 [Paenibacillus allorhizosphaerae]|uniref:Activator of Hsp90 ATPase homologue 1/2-like C-terminal domain-containing protein n=2 Tax=Paenibacillus allorhizosphaerae TaxID=2849866 RepID=A0ABM8VU96_9BACL|nr:hypothetical protein PAECIP111802_07158 [Paenibacillus allorhizosphaerae]